MCVWTGSAADPSAREPISRTASAPETRLVSVTSAVCLANSVNRPSSSRWVQSDKQDYKKYRWSMAIHSV